MSQRTRSKLIDRAQIVFEKDIPIPVEAERGEHGSTLYPVAALEVNESFSYPLLSGKEENQLISARSAFNQEIRRNPHKRFIVRALTSESIIRVWRISDTPKPE